MFQRLNNQLPSEETKTNENDQIMSSQDYQILQHSDKKYLRFLYNMWSLLKQPRIHLSELNSVMQTYDMMKQDFQEEYLGVIFQPERPAHAKIPSLFPVPSSSFLNHSQVSLTTNATGNIAFTWNPYFLQDSSTAANSTLFVNNNAALTGTASSNFFTSTDLGYALLPANLYSQYRVVGASITVTYTGRMDIVSGIIGIGVGLNQFAGNAALAAVDANSQIFGNFNLIDDAYFSKRTQAINGVRAIYFPLDPRFLQFQSLATSVNGFYFSFYGAGLPAASQCLRVDIYTQYECTVQPQFSGYITQSPGAYSNRNWLETTSDIINKNPDVVTQASSDAPSATAFSAGGGTAGVGGMFDFVSKLLGGAKKFLGSDAGKILKSIPGMGQIAEIAGNVLNALPLEDK